MSPSAGGQVTRPRVDQQLLVRLAGQLTDRDRLLLRLLDEHQVLTTPQITDVAFTGHRRCETRLRQLYLLRAVDRFRPLKAAGSAPFHWVLDQAGAAVLAADHGETSTGDRSGPPTRSTRLRACSLALASNPHLSHLVGSNSMFTGLLKSARSQPDCCLDQWWSAQRCAAEWGEVVRPDGYGRWRQRGAEVEFLLEYDQGTERLHRLTGKLPGYAELLAAAGEPIPVLFVFLRAAREAEARRVLVPAARRPGIPVATTVLTTGVCAADPVWLTTAGGTRRPLIDLAASRVDGDRR